MLSLANDLLDEVSIRVPSPETHREVVAWFETRVGWKLPFNSHLIAQANQSSKESGGEGFQGLATILHFMQCPLGVVNGKMKGSWSGEFHRRMDLLTAQGLVINLILL